MSSERGIAAIDTHTEGEPTRIVLARDEVPGATMADKRVWLRAHRDDLRRALVLEPRGHDAIVLAWVTAPVGGDADAGVVFANDRGYLEMCGHGAIGVATVLVREGLVAVRSPETAVRLDTTAGTVSARVRVENGSPRAVTLRNVPAFVQETDRVVGVPGLGKIRVDIAWGGNWFAFVRAEDVALPLERERLEALLLAGRAVRGALADQGVRGTDPATGSEHEIDHVKIWAGESAGGPAARAFTVCPGRSWDRSPCGTGTSAKLALLHAAGELAEGRPFRSRSILGTEFEARIVGLTRVGDRPAVVPEITGRAWVTGRATFVLDPDDPWRLGLP